MSGTIDAEVLRVKTEEPLSELSVHDDLVSLDPVEETKQCAEDLVQLRDLAERSVYDDEFWLKCSEQSSPVAENEGLISLKPIYAKIISRPQVSQELIELFAKRTNQLLRNNVCSGLTAAYRLSNFEAGLKVDAIRKIDRAKIYVDVLEYSTRCPRLYMELSADRFIARLLEGGDDYRTSISEEIVRKISLFAYGRKQGWAGPTRALALTALLDHEPNWLWIAKSLRNAFLAGSNDALVDIVLLSSMGHIEFRKELDELLSSRNGNAVLKLCNISVPNNICDGGHSDFDKDFNVEVFYFNRSRQQHIFNW
ncbi:hypothetical protein [Litoreibacter halocynthiae]|uniref:hypothetical protein n=1 Tax=Litoreibacter halocynthiae TaxID=1242689 RepID=UPI00249166AD|nr:hypothetical protein [Litoreibacter halocynthiae]